MERYSSLTKFIDALDMEDLGEWVTEYDSSGRLVGTPYVDYWDVVHRFCDRLLDYCDDNPGYEEGAYKGSEYIRALKSAIDREERCPGVLLGYLNNGTIVEWLRALEAVDKE